MGAQQSTSHHEPLNVGGFVSQQQQQQQQSGGYGGSGGGVPDFSTAALNHVNSTHHKPKTSLASKALNPRNTIRKSLRKRREKKLRNKENNRPHDEATGNKVSYSRCGLQLV